MTLIDAVKAFIAPLSADAVITDGADDYSPDGLLDLTAACDTADYGDWAVSGGAIYAVEAGVLASYPAYKTKADDAPGEEPPSIRGCYEAGLAATLAARG
jgi:hypothetical protein